MDGHELLGADLVTAYEHLLERRRQRRRRVRSSVIVVSGALALAGAAFGAARVFGWPAPDHVRADLAAVDQGLPADLRLNPDVSNARAVASTGEVTLYAASLKDGGYCTEIVTPGDRGRGAICTTAADVAERLIEVALPSDQASVTAPVVLGGRVNAAGAISLELDYGDGVKDQIPFGDDRFFVFSVPADHVASAHGAALALVARDQSGQVVATGSIPADWDANAVPDNTQPLYVGTRSDSSDFTKVYGIEGFVGATGAVSLELRYRDGENVTIPIADDRSYEYTVPADRVDDFFMKPQQLVVLDATGAEIATAYVAAVAYWRGHPGGRR